MYLKQVRWGEGGDSRLLMAAAEVANHLYWRCITECSGQYNGVIAVGCMQSRFTVA